MSGKESNRNWLAFDFILISFRMSLQWLFYIINSVEKTSDYLKTTMVGMILKGKPSPPVDPCLIGVFKNILRDNLISFCVGNKACFSLKWWQDQY